MESENKKKYIYSKDKIKEYNDRFKLKHKDEQLLCAECFANFKYESKYYHSKSKRHLMAIELQKHIKDNHAKDATL